MPEALDYLTPFDGLEPGPRAKGRAMIRAYSYHYHNDPESYQTVALEEPWQMDLGNGETAQGRWDGLIKDRQTQEPGILEHKTVSTSTRLEGYWQQKELDLQIDLYCTAAFQRTRKIPFVLWDVLRKPNGATCRKVKKGTRSEDITGSLAEMEQLGTYFGQDVSRPLEVESWDMVEARLLHEILAKPDLYFHRRRIQRTHSQLSEAVAETHLLQAQLAIHRLAACWNKNPKSCNDFGSVCEYMNLCLGGDPADGYRIKEDCSSHWSASRIQAYRQCPRKYYWGYVKQLEPVESKSEALKFGKAIHEALEVLWNQEQ